MQAIAEGMRVSNRDVLAAITRRLRCATRRWSREVERTLSVHARLHSIARKRATLDPSLRARADAAKSKADIVAVIGSHVRLARSGETYRGPCSFHDGREKSFHVHPASGFWFCFACESGGDVIKFVERMYGASFEDAVRILETQGDLLALLPALARRR